MRFDDDAVLRRVLVRVKDCPEGHAIDAVRDEVIAFCTKTMCVTNAAQVTTEVEAPEAVELDMADLVVVGLVDVHIDGDEIEVVPANSDKLQEADAECPVIVFAGDASNPVIVPSPSEPVVVDMLIATAPGPEAEEFADFVWQHHYRTLVDGAIARLLAQPDRAWSNPEVAQRMRIAVDREVDQAALKYGRNRHQKAHRMRLKPAPF